MRKLLLVALVLLILFPMSVAALGNVSNVSVEGSLYGPTFSIDTHMDPSPPGWGLAFGDNSWFFPPGAPLFGIPQGPPMGLTVTAHAQKDVAFSVSVSDKLDGGKPTGAKGKMAEYYVCWTFKDPIFAPAPPPGLPPACIPGGLGVAGNCSITTNRWETSGKMLTLPLVLNETVCLAPPCPPGPITFKNYNTSLVDPVLFTGIGDTQILAGVPTLGPGTTRNYDLRQRITLLDTALRVDPYPAFPTVGGGTGLEYQQIHTYKMPITFTLTTL